MVVEDEFCGVGEGGKLLGIEEMSPMFAISNFELRERVSADVVGVDGVGENGLVVDELFTELREVRVAVVLKHRYLVGLDDV